MSVRHSLFGTQSTASSISGQSDLSSSLSPTSTVYSPNTISSPMKPTSRKRKYLVAFDWDDTLYPTFSLVHNQGRNVEMNDLYKLGKSIYILLETYIHRFGFENLFILTNASKKWVLDSLRNLSEGHQSCFDGEKRDRDYFAAIYNTLVSQRCIPIISASDEYAIEYPQVKNRNECILTEYLSSICFILLSMCFRTLFMD